MHNNRIYFSQSPKPTLGVEAELYTVSKDTFNLYLGAPAILDTFADDIHVKEELLECIVEVNTKICNDVAEVLSDLTNTIVEVQKVANVKYMELVSIGTHPFAFWKDSTITSRIGILILWKECNGPFVGL